MKATQQKFARRSYVGTAGIFSFLLSGACLWHPNIEQNGYTNCNSDNDCAAGRYCDVGLCAPPPWRDFAYGQRQLVLVENHSKQTMPAGTAVPVRIGEGGVIPISDFGADARFAVFNRATGAWQDQSVYRDLFDDFLIAWLPLAEDVADGQTGTVTWIESKHEDGVQSITDTTDVFTFYDGFLPPSDGTQTLPVDDYRTFGTGQVTINGDSLIVADNQKVVLRRPWRGAVSATIKGRINGTDCDGVYMGFIADDQAGYAAPSAGLFMVQNLAAGLEVAPHADSVPTINSAPTNLDTALRRYTVEVTTGAGGGSRALVDDVVLDEFIDERNPFDDVDLYFVIDVDGACSLEIDDLWVSALPMPAPKITVETAVPLKLFSQ